MTKPPFYQGIQYFKEELPHFNEYGQESAIAKDKTAISSPIDKKAVYQTLLAADALRYLTLHITASKESGHPGGFASIADTIAALVMLGHKNLITEEDIMPPDFIVLSF